MTDLSDKLVELRRERSRIDAEIKEIEESSNTASVQSYLGAIYKFDYSESTCIFIVQNVAGYRRVGGINIDVNKRDPRTIHTRYCDTDIGIFRTAELLKPSEAWLFIDAIAGQLHKFQAIIYGE